MQKRQFIAKVVTLENAGQGLRFEVIENGQAFPAFAIRYDDKVYAYLNRCGHIAIQLDHMPGRFFSDEGVLVCATHGAQYQPDTGQCLGGPCYGVGLQALNVQEEDGVLYLIDENFEVNENVR